MSDLDELVEAIVHSTARTSSTCAGRRVESWWNGRPFSLWAARKLYDYRHLGEVRGLHVRPWVLAGRQVGRGPGNESLVTCTRPVAWVDLRVVRQATHLVDEQAGLWGPMRRR